MDQRACQAVGIDLGTTYSSLAYVDSQMTPRVVSDSSGRAVTPSVVFFDDEEIIVGEIALEQAKAHADRAVQFIKVHMGDPWRREFLGREHTPESISAMILGQLVKEAEPQIGPVGKAVITVPASFTEKRRRATQQAGEIAGLEVIGTFNEPMAATLAYGLHHASREQIVLVYDLGGGTFDVTVVRISPSELEELATSGNRQFGGRDWDRVLVDFVVDDFRKAHGADLRADEQAMQDLQVECEHAKRRLTQMKRTTIRVHAAGRDHAVDVRRSQFEELTAHLLHATKLTTEMVIKDAGLAWGRLSRVVLVGGSTHMPAVRRMLEQVSGKPPDTGVNPVLAVSLGAATYAHMLERGRGRRVIRSPEGAAPVDDRTAYELEAASGALPTAEETMPLVHFVTAHGVGVKVRSRDAARNKVLIPKNTRVPVSVTKQFYTKSTGSRGTRIKIDITQGDTDDLAVAESLGTGRIEGVPRGAPEGQPVDVTMEFDEQGRLHIHAVYVPTGQKMDLSLEIPGGLEQEEVEAQRRFLESAGFLKPIDAHGLLEELERAESLDADDPLDVEVLNDEVDTSADEGQMATDEYPVVGEDQVSTEEYLPARDEDRVFTAEDLFRDLGADLDDDEDQGDDADDLPLIDPV